MRKPKHAQAHWILVRLLVGFGDACRATGDLPVAVEAWQQARQILRDLGWPGKRRIHARLEQADATSPPG